MIEVARREAGERGIANVAYAQATIFDERYEGGSFDVVLAFHILHLLEDAGEVVQRIRNLLKPGGLFISATACMGEKSILGVLLLLLSRIGIIPHMNAFKLPELAGLIAHCGFQIVEAEKVLGKPPNYFIVARRVENDR
jgi:SAM-dependent methyltransferase